MTFNQVCLQVVNKDAPARMCLIALTSSAASHHTARATRQGTRARDVTRARVRAAIERGIGAGTLPDSTDVDALTATFEPYLLRALTQSGQEASTAPSI